MIEKAVQRVERERDDVTTPHRYIEHRALPHDLILAPHHSG
jgi:hypothetical protein